MPKFKIKDTAKIMMAYIYEVEAETEEEALKMYIDGEVDEIHSNCFIVPDLEESIVAYK